MPDPQSRHCPDFVAAHESRSGPSRQAAFFGPTVANGGIADIAGPAACPAQSLMTLLGYEVRFFVAMHRLGLGPAHGLGLTPRPRITDKV